MDIYLVRHGDYTDLGSETLEQDSLNPLTEQGIAKLERQAQVLARWQIPIDRVLTSPFIRAKQTAGILAKALHVSVEEHPALTRTRFNLQGLQQLIESYPNVEYLMLVGHESDLSTVAAEVIGGGRMELSRGGVIRISLESKTPLRGKLIWLLTPELIAK